MPYHYHDDGGFLAAGPSVREWAAMRRRLTGDQGRVLVATGACARPSALAAEILADLPDDRDLRRSMRRLARVAESADGALVLADPVATAARGGRG